MSGTCQGCWCKEGRWCYLEPCHRGEDGRSTKPAEGGCDHFDGENRLLSALKQSGSISTALPTQGTTEKGGA